MLKRITTSLVHVMIMSLSFIGIVNVAQAATIKTGEVMHPASAQTFHRGYKVLHKYIADKTGKVTGGFVEIQTPKRTYRDTFLNDITNLYAPYDPSNANIVFLSKSYSNDSVNHPNNGLTGHEIGYAIYRYNLRTKTHSEVNSFASEGTYRIIGIDGNKIILKNISDNSPGPCANSWTSGDIFYSQAIHFKRPKPSHGDLPDLSWQPYKVPQYLIDIEDKRSKRCMEDQGIN